MAGKAAGFCRCKCMTGGGDQQEKTRRCKPTRTCEARVREEFRQQRLDAIDGILARPPMVARLDAASAQPSWPHLRTAASQHPQEIARLPIPPATSLKPKHNELAAPRQQELRVSLLPFAAGGLRQHNAGFSSTSPAH